jgi:hypothetical protein
LPVSSPIGADPHPSRLHDAVGRDRRITMIGVGFMTLSRFRVAVSRRASVLGMVGALTVAAACGNTTDPGPAAKDITPATITALSADTLRGTVGSAASLPLTVTVKNAAGEPLDTVLVTFTVVTGNGSVANAAVRTNASGQASTTWTLGGVVGLQTVTASAGALAPITFRAVATVGAVSAVAKVQGDAQTAAVNSNVAVVPQVKVTDRFGNAVAATPVSFVVGSGGGSVINGVINTDANGVASAGNWRLGAAPGANTLVATASGITATFTATATFGAPATITLTPNTLGEFVIGQTQQLTPRVVDASGNVIPTPTVTYATSNVGVARVTAAGVIEATGAGTATITATAGAATASVAVTVIGHPAATSPVSQIQLGTIVPGDIGFTKDLMFIPVNGQQKVLVYDPNTLAQTATITVTSPIPILIAPTRAAGPVIAINSGTTSRVWFIDPAISAVTDSIDLPEIVRSATMTTDGTRVFVMLANGDLVVFDGATHARVATLVLGGGVTTTRMAPGDTLMYALTSVGVIFEVDVRTATVKRQIIANVQSTDFVIGRDGLFYLLDGPGGLVRLFNIQTQTTVRSVGVSTSSATINVTPDGQQIWLTQNNPGQVTVLTGNSANGFIFTGSYFTGTFNPTRIAFSPTGSLAAIGNFGGFVDIVR